MKLYGLPQGRLYSFIINKKNKGRRPGSRRSGGTAGSNPLTGRGYLGVDLFFVLSGFLITHLLIKEKRSNGVISLRNFYVRRTLRIFPLYYTYLFAVLAWAFLSSDSKLDQYLPALPYYAFYVSNWMPADIQPFFYRAWSLAVEEQFYLVWPLLFTLVAVHNLRLLVTGVVLVSVVWMASVPEISLPAIAPYLVPFRTLLLGCLLAMLLNQATAYRLIAALCRNRYAPVLVLLLFFLMIARQGPIVGVERLMMHSLMFLFVACALVNEKQILAPLLKLKPLQIIGMVSYGIYILHGQFYGAVQKLVELLPPGEISESRLVFFIAFAAVSTGIAWCSYNFYEKPFLRLKARFYPESKPQQPRAAGTPAVTAVEPQI